MSDVAEDLNIIDDFFENSEVEYEDVVYLKAEESHITESELVGSSISNVEGYDVMEVDETVNEKECDAMENDEANHRIIIHIKFVTCA